MCMTKTEEAVSRIRAWAAAQGITRHKLASLAGLSKHALRHMDDPEWDPRRKTLEALERVVPQGFDPDHNPVSRDEAA